MVAPLPLATPLTLLRPPHPRHRIVLRRVPAHYVRPLDAPRLDRLAVPLEATSYDRTVAAQYWAIFGSLTEDEAISASEISISA